jgi:hypothetical protein
MHFTKLAVGIFLNNLIGCISLYAYFIYEPYVGSTFRKNSNFIFEFLFWFILFILRLKPWFKFEYLNQIPNF